LGGDDINQQYRHAIDVLRQGGIVALPTDTVYGLCAVAADTAAVERIYDTKVRRPDQALPIFVASIEQAALVAVVSAVARKLMQRFWPGALTIVLPKSPIYDTRAAAGGDTIAVRAPGDPVLREIASQLGPITGTSANIAGQPECHTAADVRAQLGDAVDYIVDAPIDATSVPSTIVDCTAPDGSVRTIRQGAISADHIAATGVTLR
jgi:L-threonylcarbamoyladenylate synthase